MMEMFLCLFYILSTVQNGFSQDTSKSHFTHIPVCVLECLVGLEGEHLVHEKFSKFCLFREYQKLLTEFYDGGLWENIFRSIHK